jgi:hypothetical protein
MKGATNRSIVPWIHIVLAFRYLAIFIVRLKKFQGTPSVFGLSLFP